MFITVDGKEAFASDGGMPFDKTKKSVVFIHGAGMDRTVWGQQTRFIAHKGYNVLALDLPGHGKSEGPVLSSISAMADWLNRFIEAAQAGPSVFIGHSMGTLIALEAARKRPDLCKGLILAGTSARMRVHPDLIAAAEANQILAPELMTAWGHGPQAHLGGNLASGMWLLGGGVRLLEASPPGVIANDLKACDSYEDALAAAATVTAPTQIVAARFDKMTPPKAAKPIADALKQCDFHVISDAGHMMMMEAQKETRRVFLKALTQILN